MSLFWFDQNQGVLRGSYINQNLLFQFYSNDMLTVGTRHGSRPRLTRALPFLRLLLLRSILRRHSVRLRLTLLYVGLFLASAAGLLAMTYVLVEQQLPRITTNGGMIAISGGSGDQGTGAPLLQTVAVRVGQDTLDQLLIESGIALGIMAVASVGLGWLMAGRVLSPLRTITATARRISARSLHQRIAMTGPDDELKELGDTFDQLLGRLDASFRAQRQFVANASHELRTPLARQRTLLEVALRDREATNASLRAACERALVAGEQQERLIATKFSMR